MPLHSFTLRLPRETDAYRHSPKYSSNDDNNDRGNTCRRFAELDADLQCWDEAISGRSVCSNSGRVCSGHPIIPKQPNRLTPRRVQFRELVIELMPERKTA